MREPALVGRPPVDRHFRADRTAARGPLLRLEWWTEEGRGARRSALADTYIGVEFV